LGEISEIHFRNSFSFERVIQDHARWAGWTFVLLGAIKTRQRVTMSARQEPRRYYNVSNCC
jgi:hypothetical protein